MWWDMRQHAHHCVASPAGLAPWFTGRHDVCLVHPLLSTCEACDCGLCVARRWCVQTPRCLSNPFSGNLLTRALMQQQQRALLCVDSAPCTISVLCCSAIALVCTYLHRQHSWPQQGASTSQHGGRCSTCSTVLHACTEAAVQRAAAW